jgi:hypothetical protein
MTMSTAPAARSRQHSALLLRGAEAREQFHAHRVVGHALAEGVEVLLRQHGRWYQYRDLPPIHHRLERRADGDLGFAEADVAADQAVHRRARSMSAFVS